MMIDVLTLIPQRPPFVVVDVLESCGATDAVTRFVVDSGCLFVEDDELMAEGVMENMAQSCAARIGYLMKENEKMKKYKNEEWNGAGIGVIGEISGFEVMRRPRIGETVRTRIEVVEQVMNLTLAEVRMEVVDEIVARARMKIAVT